MLIHKLKWCQSLMVQSWNVSVIRMVIMLSRSVLSVCLKKGFSLLSRPFMDKLWHSPLIHMVAGSFRSKHTSSSANYYYYFYLVIYLFFQMPLYEYLLITLAEGPGALWWSRNTAHHDGRNPPICVYISTRPIWELCCSGTQK